MITVTEQPAPPHSLRTAYLNSLPEPQELFVENLVKAGTCRAILRDQREIGYAVIGSDGMLVELYLSEAQLMHLTAAFDVLVETCGVQGVLTKSFDANLLFVALSRSSQPRTLGLMYRSITDEGFVVSTLAECISFINIIIHSIVTNTPYPFVFPLSRKNVEW